jgi:hypothetical protein
MKGQGSIDRVLEAWLHEGPTDMPDRLFDAVFDQVERVPQRRLARLQLRFTDMTSTARLIAAGAAAVLVVGVGFFALGRGTEPGPGASPSPSAQATDSPGPSSTGSELPSALRHPFIGPLRTVAGVPQGDVSLIRLRLKSFSYNNGTSEFMWSDAGVDGDEIVVRSGAASPGCEVGDEGRYPFSLSPGGSILTIDPGTDDCAPRSAAIQGTWQRLQCLDPNGGCLGVVEAGTYASQYFAPAVGRGVTPVADFGALTYTVPAGWANSSDWPSVYDLMRASSYSAGGVNEGATVPDVISLLARASAARLHADCPSEAEPGVGTDRAALAAWILAHPGLVVTEQAAVTIDGLQATVLDLAVAATWSETCDETNPFVAAPLFIGDYHWAVAKGDRMRVILVDLPAGTTVAITVDPEDPARFDALVGEAMPIIESFDFK